MNHHLHQITLPMPPKKRTRYTGNEMFRADTTGPSAQPFASTPAFNGPRIHNMNNLTTAVSRELLMCRSISQAQSDLALHLRICQAEQQLLMDRIATPSQSSRALLVDDTVRMMMNTPGAAMTESATFPARRQGHLLDHRLQGLQRRGASITMPHLQIPTAITNRRLEMSSAASTVSPDTLLHHLLPPAPPAAFHPETIASVQPHSPIQFPTRNFEGDTIFPLTTGSQEEEYSMSEYQNFLRQQIAWVIISDLPSNEGRTQGRNKAVVCGQVGIACRHCAHLPRAARHRGSCYFPAQIDRVYQAAQNMSQNHFATGECPVIPATVQERLVHLKSCKPISTGTSKACWYKFAAQTLTEGPHGLQLREGRLDKCAWGPCS